MPIKLIKNKYFQLVFFSILTIAVYHQGIEHGFYFDDHVNIVDNPLLHVNDPALANFWQASWSGNSGLLGRPVSYLSFSVNWFFTGNNAIAMKLTNLVIHILVGLLLYFLAKTLLNYSNKAHKLNLNVNAICILTCGVWLLHPINLTGVLYVVQRMTSLSALFCVMSLFFYTHFRIKQTLHQGNWFPLIFTTGLFGLLALFTKESAINLIFYLAAIEIFIFKFSTYNYTDRIILKSCYAIFFSIITISLVVFLLVFPDWLSSIYDLRSFTLPERVLTESRVVIWYMKMIVAPNISEMSLFLDDFSLSKSLFNPITTLYCIFLILILFILAVYLRNRLVLFSFGVFWFFSGHLLESTILPLELAYEHRNYLPSFGVLICLISIMSYLLSREKIKPIIATLLVVWISLISYTTFLRSQQWNDPLKLALADVEYHPNSARAHIALAGIYAGLYAGLDSGVIEQSADIVPEEVFQNSDLHFKNSAALDPHFSSANVSRLILYSSYSKEFPSNEFAEIVDKLKTRRLDSSTVTALKKLTHCLIDEICHLPTEDYMKVIYAPLTREDIAKNNLALLLVFLSEYYVAILNDLDTAINLATIAIEEQPKDIHYRFILVRWLTAAKSYQEARKQLDIIREKDKLGMFTANLEAWEKTITQSSKQKT